MCFASPIYFGSISGELKCILDRFYCFFSRQFGVRDLKGKKFRNDDRERRIPRCDRPDVSETASRRWFGDFCKMECHGEVVAGGTSKGGISDQAEIEDHVRKLAKTL
ncbi:MAG: hypothetical protein U5N86_05125 [Planctomycetota bacterium]|nr:hypothetical protein [Planctomycetota bacterium]